MVQSISLSQESKLSRFIPFPNSQNSTNKMTSKVNQMKSSSLWLVLALCSGLILAYQGDIHVKYKDLEVIFERGIASNMKVLESR